VLDEKRKMPPIVRGGVIDGSKSAHGQTAAHGRIFCPAKQKREKRPANRVHVIEIIIIVF